MKKPKPPKKLLDFTAKSRAPAKPTKAETEKQFVELELGDHYRPQTPLRIMYGYGNQLPPMHMFYRDVDYMLLHPRVDKAGNDYKNALADGEFEVKARDPAVARYVQELFERLWSTSLGVVQAGYNYGWGGSEPIYRWNDDGQFTFDRLKDFHARDVSCLTDDDGNYWGFRLKANCFSQKSASVDLPGPVAGISKAFWYAHKAKGGAIHGISQFLGAWRPWRRLAQQDGGEDNIDMAVYRFGVQGPKVFYPPGDPTITEAKRDKRGPTNRDKAREVAETYKSGGGVWIPSMFDEKHGHRLWDAEFPDHTINVDSLLNYTRHLKDEIAEGIGVPPELMQASETGSGYSGRELPLESFFAGQRGIGRDIIKQFREQVADALVEWNFGPDALGYEIDIKSLLETRAKRLAGSGAGPNRGGESGGNGQGRQSGNPEPAAPGGQSFDAFDKDREPTDRVMRFATMLATESNRPLNDPAAEAAVKQVLAILAPLRTQLSKDIIKVLRSRTTASWSKVRQLLLLYREEAATGLANARVVGALAAMRRVVDQLPGLHPSPALTPPVTPPPILTALADGSQAKTYLPLIEEAANDLAGRGVLTAPEFYRLTAQAKDEAFTVSGVQEESTLIKIRDSLAKAAREGQSQAQWQSELEATIDADPFLSPAHQEVVFRNNVHAAYSNGQDKVLNHPLVADMFPYREAYAIHDHRVRPWHLAVEVSGLDGTAIYRADDPTWGIVRGPSDWGCRCGWRGVTKEQAAKKGVREAQEWVRTGIEPANPERVPLPVDWQQSPEWERR